MMIYSLKDFDVDDTLLGKSSQTCFPLYRTRKLEARKARKSERPMVGKGGRITERRKKRENLTEGE